MTPVILTFDEAPNIKRTLDSLWWAKTIIVIDSGSTDGTQEIAAARPEVRLLERKFDRHELQWSFGIFESGIETPYVLAIDADMSVPASLLQELEERFLDRGFPGGNLGFDYCCHGVPLPGSICPAQTRLFLKKRVSVTQPGRTQVFTVDGNLYDFESSLVHDDRKGLEHWASSQLRYSQLEEARLRRPDSPRRLRDGLRKLGLMPPIVGLVSYLRAGGPLRGNAAAYYAYERVTYECLLALRLIRRRLAERQPDAGERRE